MHAMVPQTIGYYGNREVSTYLSKSRYYVLDGTIFLVGSVAV